MPTLTTDYTAKITKRFDDIDKLHTTPNLIKDQEVSALKAVLNTPGLSRSAQLPIRNKIQVINNLRDESIASNFRVIYSQMCVLAVSVVESELKSYFANAFNKTANINQGYKRLNEVKFSIKEILDNNQKFGGKLGLLFLEKERLNFQDIKSIINIFKDYLGKDIVLEDEIKKKICFYFEARHLLVHKGGKVDDKFLQATSVIGANIKNLCVGDEITFDQSDWNDMRLSFTALITEVTRQRESVS
jgi:hypothetical protein